MKIKPPLVRTRDELLLKKLCLNIYMKYGNDYLEVNKQLGINPVDMISIVNIAMTEKLKLNSNED
jgi:hypothetical protein